MTDLAFRRYLDFEPSHIIEIGVGRPWAARSRPWWGKCRVTMIEANPRFVGMLRDATAKFDQVTVHGAAVADEFGKAEFYRFGHSSYLASVPGRRPANSERELRSHVVTVPTITLDMVDDGTADVVLIDIETAEWYALHHMVSRPRLLALELFRKNPDYQHHRRQEIDKWLAGNGYQLSGRSENDGFFVRKVGQ